MSPALVKRSDQGVYLKVAPPELPVWREEDSHGLPRPSITIEITLNASGVVNALD